MPMLLERKVPRMKVKHMLSKIPGVLFGVIGVFAFFAVFADGFVSMYNVSNLLKDCSLLVIVSLGMNLVIMSGRINISIGAVMSLCGVITGILLQKGFPMGIAILAGFAVGIILGAFIGYLIAYQKFSDWVVTYAFMGIAQGLALAASNGNTIPGFDNSFRFLATGEVCGIYMMIIITVVICTIMVYVSLKTKFGYNIYSIGGSEQSAKLSGIKVKLNLLIMFIISSGLAAIAGILLAAKSNSASPIGGQGYEWDAIAAVLIGGTQFEGGKGKLTGSVIGAILMRMLRNGLTMIGLSPYLQTFIIGAAVMLIIIADGYNEHHKKIQAARRVYTYEK